MLPGWKFANDNDPRPEWWDPAHEAHEAIGELTFDKLIEKDDNGNLAQGFRTEVD